MDMMDFLNETSADEIELTPADESAIFLAALQDACETEEEYNQLVMENAQALELYGLIDSAEIATEAKKIVIKQTKQMNLNREQAKAAIRIARRANSADYKKYEKGRRMMLEARAEIVKKYQSKAKTEAKKVLVNSKRKASSMNSNAGKDIVKKMDKKIAEVEKKSK